MYIYTYIYIHMYVCIYIYICIHICCFGEWNPRKSPFWMVKHHMTSAFLDDEISHAMPDVRQAWERPRSRLRLSVAAAEPLLMKSFWDYTILYMNWECSGLSRSMNWGNPFSTLGIPFKGATWRPCKFWTLSMKWPNLKISHHSTERRQIHYEYVLSLGLWTSHGWNWWFGQTRILFRTAMAVPGLFQQRNCHTIPIWYSLDWLKGTF